MISGLHRSRILWFYSRGRLFRFHRILGFHICINELRRPAVSVYRLCDQITFSVVCNRNRYIVYGFVVCYIFLPIIFLRNCVFIYARPVIDQRLKHNLSVCAVLRFKHNVSILVFEHERKLFVFQLRSLISLGSSERYRRRTSFVDISEYDAVHIFSALRLCFRAQCTVAVICHNDSHRMLCRIVLYASGCTFHLADHIIVCACFCVMQSSETNRSVRLIHCRSHNISGLIDEFKCKFSLVQITSSQLFFDADMFIHTVICRIYTVCVCKLKCEIILP